MAIKENDAEANGTTGSHLLFTKFRNRYYLFMPEFVKRQDMKPGFPENTTMSDLGTKHNVSELKSKSYWEVKISVSEFFQGKWSAKQYLKTSGDLSLSKAITNDISSYLFTHKTIVDDDMKDVLVLSIINDKGNEMLTYSFKGLHSAICISKGNKTIPIPSQGVFYQNLVMRELNYPMPDNNGIHANSIPDILSETKSEKLISFSPQYLEGLTSIYNQPFFLHDKERSYYIKTVPIDFLVGYTHEVIVGYRSRLETSLDLSLAALQHPEKSVFLPLHLSNKFSNV